MGDGCQIGESSVADGTAERAGVPAAGKSVAIRVQALAVALGATIGQEIDLGLVGRCVACAVALCLGPQIEPGSAVELCANWIGRSQSILDDIGLSVRPALRNRRRRDNLVCLTVLLNQRGIILDAAAA